MARNKIKLVSTYYISKCHELVNFSHIFRNGDVFWGGFTLSFIALPMICSLSIHYYKKCKGIDYNLDSNDHDILLTKVCLFIQKV